MVWKPARHVRWLFIVALVVLLGVLATLQYRWAGQVSEGERDRMRSGLRSRSAQFAQEFDREVTRVLVMFQSEPEAIAANPGLALSDRYEQWIASAPFPQLVDEVYLFEQWPGRAAALARVDRNTRTMQSAPWPEPLAWLRDHFAETTASPHSMSIWPDLIDDRALALLIPLLDVKIVKDERGQTRRLQTFDTNTVCRLIVVTFNRDAIVRTILPALAARHFGGDSGYDYHVAVLDRSTPPVVIYESDRSTPTDTANADLATPIMDVRLEELTGLSTFMLPALPPGGSSRIDRFALTIVRKAKDGDAPGVKGAGGSARWQLVLRHRAGSLEAAVQRSRTRNLLVSFGVLVLLALASAMVLVSTERARHLAAQQIEFVAGVSHELRTPVAVICSAAENLADGVIADDERVRRYGNLIRVEGRRLADMLERVLELAGAISGRAVSRLAPTNPAQIIDDALAASSMQIAESGIEVERRVAVDLPPVLGDATALRSAVQNLIANAVKYRGDGRSMRITALVGDGTPPMVEIAVADSGVGIDRDDLPHIFDPFFRGRTAAAGQIRGTGVGLTVVKQIVEAHGGTVSATSEPGRGSTFTIRIPVCAPALDDAVGTMREANLQPRPGGSV